MNTCTNLLLEHTSLKLTIPYYLTYPTKSFCHLTPHLLLTKHPYLAHQWIYILLVALQAIPPKYHANSPILSSTVYVLMVWFFVVLFGSTEWRFLVLIIWRVKVCDGMCIQYHVAFRPQCIMLKRCTRCFKLLCSALPFYHLRGRILTEIRFDGVGSIGSLDVFEFGVTRGVEGIVTAH